MTVSTSRRSPKGGMRALSRAGGRLRPGFRQKPMAGCWERGRDIPKETELLKSSRLKPASQWGDHRTDKDEGFPGSSTTWGGRPNREGERRGGGPARLRRRHRSCATGRRYGELPKGEGTTSRKVKDAGGEASPKPLRGRLME